MTKKILYFAILASFVVTLGCASQKIYVNGAPADTGMIILRNPESGLTIYSTVAKGYKIKEGKEVLEFQEYTKQIKPIILDKSVKSLSVALRIVNDKRVKYSVLEKCGIDCTSNGCKIYSVEVLYTGRLSFKELNTKIDTRKNQSGIYTLRILDGKGNLMMIAVDFSYERREGGGR